MQSLPDGGRLASIIRTMSNLDDYDLYIVQPPKVYLSFDAKRMIQL